MAGETPMKKESDALRRLRMKLEVESGDSARLAQDLADNPICSVAIDDSIPCVALTWKRYATSSQLRFIHESIIQLGQSCSVSKILADDTALATINAADQKWIAKDWMPRAVAVGFTTVAAKESATYYGKLSTKMIQAMAPAELTIRVFDDLNDARDWLQAA
jgi:hypothetical protein